METINKLIKKFMQVLDSYSYAYIAAASTVQVATGKCRLIAIVVNTTAAGAISVIDGTSGSTVNVASLKSSIAEGRYEFGISLAAGLRIITAANSDITVIYAKG